MDSGMRHLYSCRAEVLRLSSTGFVGGAPAGVKYEKVATEVDPGLPGVTGELQCRLALTFVRPGAAAQVPTVTGKRTKRRGSLYCDITDNLLAGDRLRVTEGSSVVGLFEIRNRPDVVSSPFGTGYMRVEVVEVAITGSSQSGTTPPLISTESSGMRHLYDTTARVLRRSTGGVFVQVTDIVDAIHGVAGELVCSLRLGFVVPGKNDPVPTTAGRAPDRVGTMFCDVTPHLRYEDRLAVESGPNSGVFELRQTPDIAIGYSAGHHMQVEVIECVRSAGAVL